MKNLDPEKIDVAFNAAVFREELDSLMVKHKAQMLLGWDGKWAKVQVMFPDASKSTVVTLMETAKGKSIRYVLDVQELRMPDTPAPLSVQGRQDAIKVLDQMMVQAAFGKVDTSKWLDKVIDAAFQTKFKPKKEEK